MWRLGRAFALPLGNNKGAGSLPVYPGTWPVIAERPAIVRPPRIIVPVPVAAGCHPAREDRPELGSLNSA